MYITAIGIGHKTAPIPIRERFYLDESHSRLLLSELKNEPAVVEAFVISTCNRTEIYALTVVPDVEVLLQQALSKVKSISSFAEYSKYFYVYMDSEAVCHLLRVASGLESLILGEQQILGQIKTAVDLARKEGMLGSVFNTLAAVTIRTGKKAQHETRIGRGGVSISWAAVNAAQRFFGSLAGRSVLIIGAGKMANLAAGSLKNKGAEDIYVMNRSPENAAALAGKFGGTSVSFWDIKEILRRVDICICSAGAPHYLVERDLVLRIMSLRAERPLFCVDISIPRNIEPSVTTVPNVALQTIDDLNAVIEGNASERAAATYQVEAIVEAKVEEFYGKVARLTTA